MIIHSVKFQLSENIPDSLQPVADAPSAHQNLTDILITSDNVEFY
jgi:hypothetical protein